MSMGCIGNQLGGKLQIRAVSKLGQEGTNPLPNGNNDHFVSGAGRNEKASCMMRRAGGNRASGSWLDEGDG